MHKVIRVLLQNMVYEEGDVIRLMGDEDDADVEDRAKDMKPQFTKIKGARLDTSKPGEQAANGQQQQQQQPEEDKDNLSEGEIEDSEFGDDPDGEWTLHKCSAAALDVFSNVYHDQIFTIKGYSSSRAVA